MNNIKVIYKFTIDMPFVNVQPGIISKLTFGDLVSIRKTEYQPAEKEIFEAADVLLTREIIDRVSEGRTLFFEGIPPLKKISDDTFQFEVLGDETILDDGTKERRLLNTAATIFEDIKVKLNEGQNIYSITNFRKTICKSDICTEEETVVTRKKSKTVFDF